MPAASEANDRPLNDCAELFSRLMIMVDSLCAQEQEGDRHSSMLLDAVECYLELRLLGSGETISTVATRGA